MPDSDDRPFISPIELFAGLTEILAKHGITHLTSKQTNEVLEGAKLIVGAVNRVPVMATPNMGIAAWLECDDTGRASRFMAWTLMGAKAGVPLAENDHPHDPSDLGRCLRFLEACPGIKDKLLVMGENCGAVWRGLILQWDALEGLYREELPTGTAPKLYAIMQQIIGVGRDEESTRRDGSPHPSPEPAPEPLADVAVDSVGKESSTGMTDVQKAICHALLTLSYQRGFDSSFPLEPIADKLGMTVAEIYDENTEQGVLWEYGPYGNGMLDFSSCGRFAGVTIDTRDLLANWCDFRN